MMVLGRIVAPFGVAGWVRIRPLGDDPLSWRSISRWWMASDENAPDDAWQAFTLKGCRMHGKSLLASFAEVADRGAAERLEGRFVAARREAMPSTASDEYYWGDLIGLGVVTSSGQALGAVSGLLETGVHDVLQVQEGKVERLIPFVASYVLKVDLAQRQITVDWDPSW